MKTQLLQKSHQFKAVKKKIFFSPSLILKTILKNPDPDPYFFEYGSGSGSGGNLNTDPTLIRIHTDPVPDPVPQHCLQPVNHISNIHLFYTNYHLLHQVSGFRDPTIGASKGLREEATSRQGPASLPQQEPAGDDHQGPRTEEEGGGGAAETQLSIKRR
jgi:hypothetical protein